MFLIRELPDKKTIKKTAETSPETDATSVLAILSVLKASSDVMVLTEKFFSQRDLSHSRFTAISILIKHTDGMYPNELADEMGVSRATASTILKGLEVSGMVTVMKAEKDGRMKKIALTDNGRDVYEKLLPEYYALLSSCAGKQDKKELKSLPDIMADLS